LRPVVRSTFSTRVLDLPNVSNDLLAAGRQTKAVLIRDEREARPCFEVARDFRALDLKKHKHYRPAMKIANVRMPHDEIAPRRDCRPVHNLVLKVLMSRRELRSEIFYLHAAR
jgi:hypothetical protein